MSTVFTPGDVLLCDREELCMLVAMKQRVSPFPTMLFTAPGALGTAIVSGVLTDDDELIFSASSL